jgi:sugar lactone lactonase YvrE
MTSVCSTKWYCLLFRFRAFSAVVLLLLVTAGMTTQALAQLPQTAVGHVSAPMSVTVKITTAGVLASVQALDPSQVVLPGTLSPDFMASLGTCTPGPVTVGQSCHVQVTFSPQYPGLRVGAVQLLDSTGAVLGMAYVNGQGMGPLAAFEITTSAAQTSTIATTLGYSVATDSWGNVYSLNLNGTVLVKPSADLAAAGALPKTLLVHGLDGAYGIAVDAVGNIYFGDYGNGRVVVVPYKGGSQTTLPITGTITPYGLALDGLGNLFIADKDNNRVVKTSVTGGTLAAVGTGLKAPTSVAVDAAGNVYISDTGNSRVVKVAAATGTQTVVTGLNGLAGLAVDAAGSIYGVNNNNQIVVAPPATGSLNVVSTLSLKSPHGVAVDMQGNLYIAEFNGRVLKVNRHEDAVNGLAIKFPLTFASGSVRASVAVENVGNQSLHVPEVSGTDQALQVNPTAFALLSGGFGACFAVNQTADTVLSAGARCQLGIQFQPPEPTGKTEVFNDSVTLTPTDQVGFELLSLSGTDEGVQMSLSASPSTSTTYGKSVTVTVRLSPNVGLPSGVVIYLLDGLSGPQISVSNGVAIIPLGVIGAGTHSLEVDFYPTGQTTSLVTKTLSLNVSALPLTIRVNNQSRYYGSLNPPLTGSLTGPVATSQADIDGISVVYTTPATAASAVGTYSIAPLIVDPNNKQGNYVITIIPGTLKVGALPLVITPDGGKTKPYGQLFTAFTGTITGNLKNGDAATVVYSSLGAPSTAAGGTYDIVAASLKFSSGTASNYSITAVTAKDGLTVTPVAITITPDGGKTKIYGKTSPILTGVATGLLNGDTVLVQYASTGSAMTAPVGSYDITVKSYVFTKGSASSYTVTTKTATAGLTIKPATLVLTAFNKSRTYGQANPVFAGTIVGQLLGDGITAIYSTTATQSSPAGSTFPIVPSPVDPNNKMGNYTPVFSDGTLSIKQAMLTATADNQTSVYGAPLPAFTGALSGVGATEAVTDGITVTGTTTATPASAPKAYTITTQVNDPNHKLSNYILTKKNGLLTMVAAPLTVVVDNQTWVIGQPMPTLTGTLTGVVSGDGITVTYSTTATSSSPAGTYPITATLNDPNKKLGNYTVTVTTGTMTVTN